MSFHLKDDFKAGTPISAVGAEWFNTVARFFNALIGGLGVKITKPTHPGVGAPVLVEIDPDAVMQAIHKKQRVFVALETPTATKDSGNQIPTAHMKNGQMALLPSTSKWTRGEKDANGNLKGVKVYLPTDGWDTSVRNCLAWRLCEFDAYGHLQSVAEQTILTYGVSIEQLA